MTQARCSLGTAHHLFSTINQITFQFSFFLEQILESYEIILCSVEQHVICTQGQMNGSMEYFQHIVDGQYYIPLLTLHLKSGGKAQQPTIQGKQCKWSIAASSSQQQAPSHTHAAKCILHQAALFPSLTWACVETASAITQTTSEIALCWKDCLQYWVLFQEQLVKTKNLKSVTLSHESGKQ